MFGKKMALVGLICLSSLSYASNYNIVDTNQKTFYNNSSEIKEPKKEDKFYGQDGNFTKNPMSYEKLEGSLVKDKITGLTWTSNYKVLTLEEALEELENMNKGQYSDWRLPSIKELYSLVDFSGVDPDARTMDTSKTNPFINTEYFDFEYGLNGTRPIDTQLLSSTIYKGYTMNNDKTVFGLNIADGRIKGYPIFNKRDRKDNKFTVYFVRGNEKYGLNDFVDNKDNTITDKFTDLMWSKDDSLKGMDWKESLNYAKDMNEENYLGYNDWRVPNAKEMHSIINYNNSPQHNNLPAIDSIFNTTVIKGEDNKKRYPYYWTSTTHKEVRGYSSAVYFTVGEGLGYMSFRGQEEEKKLMDVHGAGSQRNDPKSGNSSRYKYGRGPQGDVIRIENFVRLVRDYQ